MGTLYRIKGIRTPKMLLSLCNKKYGDSIKDNATKPEKQVV